MRPRLLDLFCGAGGAGRGYHRAGFEVVGVDLRQQPRYPFDVVDDDALWVLELLLGGEAIFSTSGMHTLGDFAAIHASPPCQAHSLVSGFQHANGQHADLIGPVRELLDQTGLPYVIENVPNAPVRRDLVLCGEMFGLRVHRHRLFECGGWFAMALPHQPHQLRGAKTNCEVGPGVARWITGHYADHDDASDAMGIDWMSRDELPQAIPPAYTEYIGHQLIAHLANRQEPVHADH